MRRALIALAVAVASWADVTATAQSTQAPSTAPADSPAGPAAYSCGNPTSPPQTSGRGAQPIFSAGQFPVSLPAMSLLGARNDLPNPYEPGVDWGQLPAGRKWGSTASVTTGPDGTIWVADRCGNSGAGGTTCGGHKRRASIPSFSSTPPASCCKSFGAGMFVSPHKLTLDDGGQSLAGRQRRPSGVQADAGRQSAADARQEGRRRSRQRRVRCANRSRRRAEWRHLRRRRPHGRRHGRRQRAHRQIRQDREVHQDVGQEGHGPRRIRRASHAGVRFTRPAVRRRSSEQPHPDFRPGRQVHRPVVPVRPTERHLHRQEDRHAVCR